MPSRSTVLVASVAGVLGGALIGGSALVGAHAAGPSTAPASATSTRACGAAAAKLPADLRAALLAARAEPAGTARRQALREIRRDMLAGKYGAQVQRVAEHRLGKRAERWAQLPAALKADLAALKDMTPTERTAARKKIREDALAGKYGAQVQQRAEKRQQRLEQCRAQKGGSQS